MVAVGASSYLIYMSWLSHHSMKWNPQGLRGLSPRSSLSTKIDYSSDGGHAVRVRLISDSKGLFATVYLTHGKWKVYILTRWLVRSTVRASVHFLSFFCEHNPFEMGCMVQL